MKIFLALFWPFFREIYRFLNFGEIRLEQFNLLLHVSVKIYCKYEQIPPSNRHQNIAMTVDLLSGVLETILAMYTFSCIPLFKGNILSC